MKYFYVLLCALVVLISGCGSFLSEVGGEGEPCSDNEKCKGSLVCIYGICTDSTFECSEGVCLDYDTGFEWQQNNPVGDTRSWHDALTYCQNLDLNGGGWRVPNISELRTLVSGCAQIETNGICNVNEECEACGINASETCLGAQCYESSACAETSCEKEACLWNEKLNGGCEFYWSSSEYNEQGAWGVYFKSGGVGYYDKNYEFYYVRCVRDHN